VLIASLLKFTLCFHDTFIPPANPENSLWVAMQKIGRFQIKKTKKRMAALRAAILFLVFDFVLTQSTVAIIHESVVTLS
jgi:hypothetical protein